MNPIENLSSTIVLVSVTSYFGGLVGGKFALYLLGLPTLILFIVLGYIITNKQIIKWWLIHVKKYGKVVVYSLGSEQLNSIENVLAYSTVMSYWAGVLADALFDKHFLLLITLFIVVISIQFIYRMDYKSDTKI